MANQEQRITIEYKKLDLTPEPCPELRGSDSAGGQVTTFEFEKDLRLGHDLIDPTQPDQRIDVVYPRLIELINQ